MSLTETEEEQTREEASKEPQKAPSHRFHAWSNTYKQLLRYCLVGGINTLFDICMLNVLLWYIPTHNALVLMAYNSVAYTCGAVSSFLLNKYWTFRHTHKATWQELRRFTLSLLLEVLYSNGLIWLAGKALQPFIPNITLWGNASKLVAIIIGTVLSYLLMRFWIFARHKPIRRD